VTRKIGLQNENHPEIFLVEIINPDTPYKLVIERRALGKILFRKNILVRNGFNRVCIPYSEIGYTQGVRNDLSLYPECDKEVDVYICSLDIVSLNLPLCECIDMPKLKCVVWDLDNTLWEGILSECNDVKLRNDVVEIIKELDKRGILNSIASKNDYDEAYKKLEEFGISEYFLCPQINWELKSGNIKRISQILDIGLDTFAFVDDMQYEREEVRNILPVARTYDALDLKNFLSKEETNVPITEESKKRRCSYVEIAKRNIEQSVFSGDLESFVKTCSIVIDVRKPVVADYTRCNELIQRTNQLNLSGKRVTFEEMISMFESNQFVTHTIRAYDKYGDYGLVGVAVYQINDNDKSMEMIHFVLSCRAARKLIEQSYFEYMIQYFGMQGFNTFVVDCAITEKNNLMRESIADIFGKKNQFLDELHYKVVLECDNYKTKYANLMEVKYSQE
jgi:FkbH-like protein